VYTGNGATSRDITGVGFFPEYVHVTRSGSSFRSTHKPASTGIGTDRSLLFESRLGEPDNIQALQRTASRSEATAASTARPRPTIITGPPSARTPRGRTFAQSARPPSTTGRDRVRRRETERR
jgi:hypothetical protein